MDLNALRFLNGTDLRLVEIRDAIRKLENLAISQINPIIEYDTLRNGKFVSPFEYMRIEECGYVINGAEVSRSEYDRVYSLISSLPQFLSTNNTIKD